MYICRRRRRSLARFTHMHAIGHYMRESIAQRERETVCAEHSAEQKDYTIQMMQDFGSLFTIHKIQIIIVKLGVNIDVH